MDIYKLYLLPLLLLSVYFENGRCHPANNKVRWNYNTQVGNEELSENDILSRTEFSKSLKTVSFPDVKYYLKHLLDILNIKKFIKNIGTKFETETACLSCKFAVAFLQHYANGGATENDIGSLVNKICSMFHIEKPRVCAGLTELFKGEVTYVLANVALNPSEFCGVLIEGCGKVVNPLHNWTIPLTPFPKPPVKPPVPPKPGAPIVRVLHLSDVHLDPLYQEGSNADCGEPLCCREDSGKPASPRTTAGHWGDYRNCDLPLRTLENMLSHVNQTHKIDYVIWTGDIPPHDIWNNTRKEAVYLLHAASKLIHKYLGHVPVFPALGNHESSPVNSFPIPTIKGNESISWLYNEVAKAWSPWLPDSSFTLKLGAYYSVLVNPGFRIVSINMNYCNSLNWWLLLNSTDPANELSWLVSELQKAEFRNEKVHILGHIPPGAGDCLPVWSNNFNRIINRYESTVTAQFFGHTHNDEFEIFYDKSGPKPRPMNIGYIGPSVTTYNGLNPGYRIYTVDGNYPKSSRVILDHETYYMNLTEANLNNKPVWRFEYSAKKAYNLTSLLPAAWDDLTYRFFKDDELFQKFYKFFYKMSDYPVEPCDETCKKGYLCRLRRGKSDDPLIC